MERFMNKKWERFPLKKTKTNNWIFDIKKCKCSCAWDLGDWEDIMYLWAKKNDNWFMKMVAYDEELVTKWNCIVFICDWEGSVWYSNYMDRDFIGSTTLSVGYNENLNKNIWLFLVTLLDLERAKYSYWRKYATNLPKAKIKLPITDEWTPDWEYMENYINNLKSKNISTKNISWKNNLLIHERKDFKIWKLFDVKLSKWDIKIDDVEEWTIPLVSSWETNNWITWYISEEWDGEAEMFEWNKITIDMFCNVFYQPERFYSVSHGRVNILVPKFKLTKYIWLFIATIISKEQFKYSYWRAVYSDESSNMLIKLPIKKDIYWNAIIDNTNEFSNEWYIPDREFMEIYIKNLPYWDRI